MTEKKNIPKNSVGIVRTQTKSITLGDDGFKLSKGGVLSEITVAYETYGELSPGKDNVVYICTALTGDAHVAGYHEGADKPGWWEEMVGPGKGIDTNYYYVVCSNILGGCQGTTGPASVNPETGKPYGSSFPDITVSDIVDVQKIFLEQLGIERLSSVVGGSFGGMQVLEWSIRYPELVESCICIATGLSLSAQALAFDVVARDAITSDPNWAGGDYYESGRGPEWGLSHARKIGHITYLSPEIMQQKFGREKAGEDKGSRAGQFQVQSYLDYQGQKLVERFDANSYLKLTSALDDYDLTEEHGSAETIFEKVRSKFLVVSLSTDWLFPPEQSEALANALLRAGKSVSCVTLEAPYGHDAFLIDIERLAESVRAFLPWVQSLSAPKERINDTDVSREHAIIVDRVKKGAKVLDLGCGDGTLLSLLSDRKDTTGFGVDISLDNVIKVINRGHDVFLGNLDEGLSVLPDKSYDYGILGSTLQQVKDPTLVLREMTRISKECLVTFPNFGYWRNRLSFGLKGRMPKSRALPYEWYETPNIHMATKSDFVYLCKNEGIEIKELVCLPEASFIDSILLSLGLKNAGAFKVVARLERKI